MESRATQAARTERRGVRGELRQTFRSLRHPNFRLYFFGQMVSLLGTWMQGTALAWLVYRMTEDARLLGLVEFASLFPVLLLALVGGWVADKADRRKVLIFAQAVAMLQASALAWLTITGQVEIWQIIMLAGVMGVVNSFEIPSRQALVVNMVQRKDFVNAVSLNSSLFNGTRIIAPAIAAVIVFISSEGVCFAINALSYLASMTALIMIRMPLVAVRTFDKPRTITDGLKYAFSNIQVRSLLRFTAFMSFFGAQFTFLMPVVAKDVLHSGIDGVAALRCLAGMGSFVAAIVLASRGSATLLMRGVGAAGLLFAGSMLLYSISANLALSLLSCFLMGMFMTFQISGTHSLLQLTVPDELRGRLMSVWTMFIMGLSPLGSLLSGWIAQSHGAPAALTVCALVCLLSSLFYVVLKR